MSKIRDLPEIASLDDDDLLYAVDVSAGTNGGRKIKKSNLKAEIELSEADVKAKYESNPDTNAFTDFDKTKLDGIEAGATQDQSASEVPYNNNLSGLSSDNVKTAIDELQSTKEPSFSKNTAFNKDFGTTSGTVVEGNDLRLSVAQKLIVKKNPGAGQFSSIKAAIDSIADASPLKPYEVDVAPGVYVEETISVPSYVFIHGERSSTIVQPLDPESDIFQMSSNTGLAQLKLEGAIGFNAAAVRRIGGTTDTTLNQIEFGSNQTLVDFNSTGGNGTVVLTNCRINAFSEFETGFFMTGTGTGALVINNLTGQIAGAGVNPSHLIRVSGDTNTLVVFGTEIRVSPPASIVNGLTIEDGVRAAVTGLSLIGPDTGIFVPNIGAGPVLNITNSVIVEDVVNSAVIANPNTTGFLTGAWNSLTAVIDETASGNMNILFTESENEAIGFVSYGDILQGVTGSDLINISKLNREEATLGLLAGGDIQTTATPLQLNISAGDGYINDGSGNTREVTWNQTFLLIPANSSRYITVNSNNLVQSEASLPDDLSQRVILGRVTTQSSSFITVEKTNLSSNHHGNLVERYLRKTFGAIYSSGSTVTENGSTNRSLDVTQGEYYFGTSRFTPSGGTEITFTTVYRDGLGGFTLVPSQTVISNTTYDNGSGIPQAIPAGEYTKGVLLLSGDGSDEAYIFVVGQETFADINDAVAAGLPTLPSVVGEALTPIAAIIVQQGSDPISQIIDARPRPSFAALSSLSGTPSDHGVLTGLTDDDHPQYFLTNGNRVMTGNIDMGTNNINNLGTVNNISIQAHASRHLPNGADPLATAAPVTNLSGNTSNTVGTANSLARSDHTHAVNNATNLVSGFMSATDKTKLDTIESGATQDQSASEVPYDNSISGLTSTNVKGALDEVDGRLDTAETNIANHVNGTSGRHDATEIDYERADGSKVDIQGTSDNVEAALTDLDDNKLSRTGSQPMAGSLNMGTNNVINAGTVNGVTVQAHASRHLPGGADALATAAPIDPLGGTSANSEGSASSFSRSDHSHDISTGAASGLTADSINTEGSSANLARADHSHDIATGVPSTQLPAQVNAEGSSANLARADHSHNIPVGAAIELTDSTNGVGSASSFARSDHTHSHGNRGGGTLHAAATTSVNGFMTAADKTKLNQLAVGHLSYSNSATLSTSSTSFVTLNVDTDRESFANSLLTKVNATDFRADFTGQVRITYSVTLYPGDNDRCAEFAIQRNATDLTWTRTIEGGKSDVNRRGSATKTIILNCTNGDIFRFRCRSIEGTVITIGPDYLSMFVEAYRVS